MPGLASNMRMLTAYQPSPLDAATIYHFADGRQQIVYPDAEKKAAEREAHAQYWARHAAEAEREQAITDRVKAYVAIGDGGEPGDARGRLVAHRTWMERTARGAQAAAARRAETAAAVQRHADNRGHLVAIEAAVATDYEEWVHFGAADPQPQPDSRLAERLVLRARIDADAEAARVAPSAERCTVALALILPLREREALVEAEVPAIEARICNAAAELTSAYAELAALDAVASLDHDVSLELGALGVARPNRLVRDQKVGLPALPTGPVNFEIKSDPCATTRYRLALAAQHTTTTNNNGNDYQLALSAPTTLVERLGHALSVWKGE